MPARNTQLEYTYLRSVSFQSVDGACRQLCIDLVSFFDIISRRGHPQILKIGAKIHY